MTDPISLASYAADKWLPAGNGMELVSSIDGTIVARMPEPADAWSMLNHAQLLLGSPGDLLDWLDEQDSVAFPGSAQTANRLKGRANSIENTVRFNAEQDRLNASILAPDVKRGDPEFDLFVKEVVREMSQKAGQKCTAIRRVLVQDSMLDAVQEAVVARLEKMTLGDPQKKETRVGALAGPSQRDDVIANLDLLGQEAEVVTGGSIPDLVGELQKGAFFEPTLLRCEDPVGASTIHAVEAFGPVATIVPYRDTQEAIAIANAGKGSIALSIFSQDAAEIGAIICGASPFHGRILVIDRNFAQFSAGHGAALPHLLHGSPGRAGGGGELGGAIGMMPYLQRSAIQACSAIFETVEGF